MSATLPTWPPGGPEDPTQPGGRLSAEAWWDIHRDAFNNASTALLNKALARTRETAKGPKPAYPPTVLKHIRSLIRSRGESEAKVADTAERASRPIEPASTSEPTLGEVMAELERLRGLIQGEGAPAPSSAAPSPAPSKPKGATKPKAAAAKGAEWTSGDYSGLQTGTKYRFEFKSGFTMRGVVNKVTGSTIQVTPNKAADPSVIQTKDLKRARPVAAPAGGAPAEPARDVQAEQEARGGISQEQEAEAQADFAQRLEAGTEPEPSAAELEEATGLGPNTELPELTEGRKYTMRITGVDKPVRGTITSDGTDPDNAGTVVFTDNFGKEQRHPLEHIRSARDITDKAMPPRESRSAGAKARGEPSQTIDPADASTWVGQTIAFHLRRPVKGLARGEDAEGTKTAYRADVLNTATRKGKPGVTLHVHGFDGRQWLPLSNVASVRSSNARWQSAQVPGAARGPEGTPEALRGPTPEQATTAPPTQDELSEGRESHHSFAEFNAEDAQGEPLVSPGDTIVIRNKEGRITMAKYQWATRDEVQVLQEDANGKWRPVTIPRLAVSSWSRPGESAAEIASLEHRTKAAEAEAAAKARREAPKPRYTTNEQGDLLSLPEEPTREVARPKAPPAEPEWQGESRAEELGIPELPAVEGPEVDEARQERLRERGTEDVQGAADWWAGMVRRYGEEGARALIASAQRQVSDVRQEDRATDRTEGRLRREAEDVYFDLIKTDPSIAGDSEREDRAWQKALQVVHYPGRRLPPKPAGGRPGAPTEAVSLSQEQGYGGTQSPMPPDAVLRGRGTPPPMPAPEPTEQLPGYAPMPQRGPEPMTTPAQDPRPLITHATAMTPEVGAARAAAGMVPPSVDLGQVLSQVIASALASQQQRVAQQPVMSSIAYGAPENVERIRALLQQYIAFLQGIGETGAPPAPGRVPPGVMAPPPVPYPQPPMVPIP